MLYLYIFDYLRGVLLLSLSLSNRWFSSFHLVHLRSAQFASSESLKNAMIHKSFWYLYNYYIISILWGYSSHTRGRLMLSFSVLLRHRAAEQRFLVSDRYTFTSLAIVTLMVLSLSGSLAIWPFISLGQDCSMGLLSKQMRTKFDCPLLVNNLVSCYVYYVCTYFVCVMDAARQV